MSQQKKNNHKQLINFNLKSKGFILQSVYTYMSVNCEENSSSEFKILKILEF